MKNSTDEQRGLVRVLIADESVSYSAGLSAYLATVSSIMVVAQVVRASAIFDAARAARPNLVILDTTMENQDPTETIRRLTNPQHGYNTAVMVLTAREASRPYSTLTDMQNAIAAGATSYLFKEAGHRGLVAAVHQTAANRSVLELDLLRELVEQTVFDGAAVSRAVNTSARLQDLTLRELEVLALVGRGLTNSEISEHLDIAHTTVKNHVSAILRKLMLRDRTQAAIVSRDFQIEHISPAEDPIRIDALREIAALEESH